MNQTAYYHEAHRFPRPEIIRVQARAEISNPEKKLPWPIIFLVWGALSGGLWLLIFLFMRAL
jgi:hypothetical protein